MENCSPYKEQMSFMPPKPCIHCGSEVQALQNSDVNSFNHSECYCPVCGFKEIEQDMLNNTNAEMSYNKTFQCLKCVKSFTQFSSLKRHVNSHSGARPFLCDLCQKCFSTKAALKRHKIIHTGECPFECSTCKRKFNQISNLRKHLLIHSNNCPYYCNFCGKGFNQLSNLKKHAVGHKSNRTEEPSLSKEPEHSAIPKGLEKGVTRPVLTFIRPADS